MTHDPKNLINIRFVLRTDQHQDRYGRFAIHMILSKGAAKANIATGEKCMPDEWLPEKRLTTDEAKNLTLENLRQKAYTTTLKLYLDGKGFTPYAVKADMFPRTRYVNHGQPTLKELYMNRLRQKSKGKRGYTPETLRNYTARWSRISAFLNYKFGKPDIPLRQVDRKFAHEFNDWMLTHEDDARGIKPLSPHTAVNIHKKLKATIRDAIARGIEMVNPYDNFTLREPPSDPTYLTGPELKRLMEVELPNDTADLARDYFVFSCFTAFRLQDAIDATWDNVIEEDGKRSLRLTEIGKTDVPHHEIPLLPPAAAIIDKYKPFNFRDNHLLPRLEKPTINRWLKLVGALAGVKHKNISHNVSRHTCATTVLMENGTDLPVVQRFMGHRSPKSTMVYAKVTMRKLEEETGGAYQKFTGQ